MAKATKKAAPKKSSASSKGAAKKGGAKKAALPNLRLNPLPKVLRRKQQPRKAA